MSASCIAPNTDPGASVHTPPEPVSVMHAAVNALGASEPSAWRCIAATPPPCRDHVHASVRRRVDVLAIGTHRHGAGSVERYAVHARRRPRLADAPARRGVLGERSGERVALEHGDRIRGRGGGVDVLAVRADGQVDRGVERPGPRRRQRWRRSECTRRSTVSASERRWSGSRLNAETASRGRRRHVDVLAVGADDDVPYAEQALSVGASGRRAVIADAPLVPRPLGDLAVDRVALEREQRLGPAAAT